MANRDNIQVDYEELEQITSIFAAQADLIDELKSRLTQAYHPLQDGGWEGKGADAFFQEMDDDIWPMLSRLLEAFEGGETLISQIIRTFQTAEEEAAAQMNFEADGAGGAAGGIPNPSGRRNPGSWATHSLNNFGFTASGQDADGRLNGTIELSSGRRIKASVSFKEMQPLFGDPLSTT